MKLFTRYNRINLASMVAIFLLSSIAYYLLLKMVLIHELDEVLVEKKDRIAQYVQRHGQLPAFQEMDEFIITSVPGPAGTVHNNVTQLTMIDPEEGHPRDFRQLAYDQPVGGQNYVIHISLPVEGTRILLRAIAGITVFTILLIILLSILLNRLLLKKLWRPFYDTIAALRTFRISRHKMPPLPDTDIDEFVFLKENLTLTIQNAQQEYHLLKEFTENASHELQTPLAIIRSRLDLLIQDENLSARQTELLSNTYSAITKLSRLNQSLLLLTKIENNQFPAIEAIPLKDKLEEKIEQLQELWTGMGITVQTDLQTTTLHSNPALVDVLLNNLLSNASKHNHEAGTIHIRLRPHELRITNTGQSRTLDTTRIFKRFYKEQQHNNSNGLGLSIVKEICERAHLTIQYTYASSGHTFTLTLPG